MKRELLEQYKNHLTERPSHFDEFVNLRVNYLDIDNDKEYLDVKIISITKIEDDLFDVVMETGKNTRTPINMTKKELKNLQTHSYTIGNGYRLEIPTNE